MRFFEKFFFLFFVLHLSYCSQTKPTKQYLLDPLMYSNSVKKTDRDAFEASSFRSEFESARHKMYAILKDGEFKDLENFLDKEYFGYSEEGGGIKKVIDFDGKTENLHKIQQILDKNSLLDTLKGPKIHTILIYREPVQYIDFI